MSETPDKPPPKWHHPSEVMKLHNLKLKKRALQARIKGKQLGDTSKESEKFKDFTNIQATQKRKNPFIIDNVDNKRNKIGETSIEDESTDQTLFKILNQTNERLTTTTNLTFENVLEKINDDGVVVVKNKGDTRLPIDWTLKRKLRLWSPKPFPWNQKLKINEEASGITAFARCLDIDDDENRTKLDTSPNSRFHQCCLYWQYPSVPWLTLFPRNNSDNKTKISDNTSSTFVMNSVIRANLHNTWTDSLRSLFQLIRTKQCPYFYCCANNFTILFRAAGICGFSDVHVLICPTTRGFRQALKQNDIEFLMPLKNNKRQSDQGYDTQDSTITEPNDDNFKELKNRDLNHDDDDDDDDDDDEWLKSMGINSEDIKQINYTQAKIVHKTECEIDHSEQSLVLIEGVEVHAFYNYLINCKSITSTTGQLAGIPPTLLSPVAFNGATLNTLKIRENKVHIDNSDYYSIELLGPILPTTVHNLFTNKPIENNMSATFANLSSTSPFSKITKDHSPCSNVNTNNTIFDKENLCDCGLNRRILEQFCQPNQPLTSIECLKYNCDNKTYQWT